MLKFDVWRILWNIPESTNIFQLCNIAIHLKYFAELCFSFNIIGLIYWCYLWINTIIYDMLCLELYSCVLLLLFCTFACFDIQWLKIVRGCRNFCHRKVVDREK